MKTTRRDVLRSLAAGATLAALPIAIRDALAVEAYNKTKSIGDVQHVVILMLENRSFDHYFGTMKGVRGFGDRFPIPLESGKPVWFENDGTRDITPFHLDKTKMSAVKLHTTSHEMADTQAAWNQGKYGFWPKFKIDITTGEVTGHSMGYYTREEIPFQWALAEAFTLCDNYHCGTLSGTDPNRIFFWSGANYDPAIRAHGRHQRPETSEPNNARCWIKGAWPDPGYSYKLNALTWPTIPDVLQKAGVSWRIYQNPNDNWTGSMNGCLAFRSFREAKKGSPIYENGMSHWSLDNLAEHVKLNKLPQVSWILPSQAESEHAGGSSTAHGADFTHRVLSTLTSNPEVWSKTVLFITFDENDGWFDHAPPPAVPSLNLDGSLAGGATLDVKGMYFDAAGVNYHTDVMRAAMIEAYPALRNKVWMLKSDKTYYIDERDKISGMVRPMGMGPRVPMYVISPWSKGGWVSSQVYDHSSVGQFLEKRFGVTVPAISPWTRAVAGDLTNAFDFVSPNDPEFPKLPDTSGYAVIEAQQDKLPRALPPAKSSLPRQERGTRPSRPTPYELHTDCILNADGEVSLRFASTSKQGAVFHVYDQRHLDRIPRRYTVEAGKTFEDNAWNDKGPYDLIVYGPNSFVRTFKGNTKEISAFDAQLHYDTKASLIRLKVRNNGAAEIGATITPNAYRNDGPWPLSVAPGNTKEHSWILSDTGNWYDFTLTAHGFERRFAGRMENGRNLVSDPAM